MCNVCVDCLIREKTEEVRRVAAEMARISSQAIASAYNQLAKPPIGVMPRKIWLRQRRQELYDAMTRYRDAGLEVPEDWKEELNNLF